MRVAPSARLILGLTLAIGSTVHADAAERDRRSGARLRATAVIESLALAAPTMSGVATVRITYPTARERYPIVVLSQGARSAPAMYARLAEYWAARGHVVIQPVPPELSPIGTDVRTGAARHLPGTVEARIADIRFILSALDQIESRARVLRGRLDRERIAVAGHSTGALATLLVAGPRLTYVADGSAPPPGEASIDAVVLVGDPSRTGIVPDDAWRALAKPSLLATGTNDEGEAPASGQRPAVMFNVAGPATPAPRYELFVRGLDVCLGGLFCRAQPGTTPDLAALSAIAEATAAFFDAYLRNDAAAAEWLHRDSPADFANGRAKLTRH
ncbi:MAG: alpha/beta hydrolase family protein [Gammaproteobacteria bacterium]